MWSRPHGVGCVSSLLLKSIIFQKPVLIYLPYSEEETGSAEEQPVSNKADAYTIVKGS